MKAAHKFFAPLSSAEMVKLLNRGAAPGSSEAIRLVLSSGQIRRLVVWSWVLALQLAGLGVSMYLWWEVVILPGEFMKPAYSVPAFAVSTLCMGLLAFAILDKWCLAQESTLGKMGCLRWTRTLNSSPKDCQKLLGYNAILDGTAVQAVNRPLYLADLAWAEERLNLRLKEEREAAAAAQALISRAAEEELAAACVKVHALVKTTTCD